LSGKIQAIRGMHDVLPEQSVAWRRLENTIINIIRQYSYQEIRLPILEKTELFQRSIGELTDIVAKEMYSFLDRNQESLTLRPEGTAGCVRAGMEHGLFHNQQQKLWYIGAMFRHERPQKGRQRQFHQVGLEAFGMPGPDVDAEMILICTRILRALRLDVQLELNTLGTVESRLAYRDLLVAYFNDNRKALDEDSLRRLDTNPLRILDSKNPDMKQLINSAPALPEHIDNESVDHFEALKSLLEQTGVHYRLNPQLVRGLDYYTRTVFEWTTDQLGAQGTVCAGGRFDGLVEHFGGKPTPAIGCAMGLERLLELVNLQDGLPTEPPHACLVMAEGSAANRGLKLAEELRDQLPGLRLLTICGGGSFKSQFKKADKSGAILALVLGEEEYENQAIGIKSLRDNEVQLNLQQEELPGWLKNRLAAELNLC
jgi:histidyl-tRNA synthetase